jgi:hypothetical protein
LISQFSGHLLGQGVELVLNAADPRFQRAHANLYAPDPLRLPRNLIANRVGSRDVENRYPHQCGGDNPHYG